MRNLIERQKEAIRLVSMRHKDVVSHSYKDIKIIRATNKDDKAVLIVFRGKSSKPVEIEERRVGKECRFRWCAGE